MSPRHKHNFIDAPADNPIARLLFFRLRRLSPIATVLSACLVVLFAASRDDLVASAGALPRMLPAQSSPAVVSAASGILPLGGMSVTLPVNVSNVPNLGAVTVELGYDNSVVAPVQCRINRADFNFSLCNPFYDGNKDGVPDAVRFALTASEGVTTSAGVPLLLVEISWQVTGTASVGVTTPLSVTVDTFDTPQGLPLPVAAQHGEILIGAAPTPTATPTVTATSNATATAPAAITATATAIGTATPTATATATPTFSPTETATSTLTPTITPTVTPTELAGTIQSNLIYLPSVASK